MENPIKIDDLGVPLFSETPIYNSTYFEGEIPSLYAIFFFGPFMSRLHVMTQFITGDFRPSLWLGYVGDFATQLYWDYDDKWNAGYKVVKLHIFLECSHMIFWGNDSQFDGRASFSNGFVKNQELGQPRRKQEGQKASK